MKTIIFLIGVLLVVQSSCKPDNCYGSNYTVQNICVHNSAHYGITPDDINTIIRVVQFELFYHDSHRYNNTSFDLVHTGPRTSLDFMPEQDLSCYNTEYRVGGCCASYRYLSDVWYELEVSNDLNKSKANVYNVIAHELIHRYQFAANTYDLNDMHPNDLFCISDDPVCVESRVEKTLREYAK